MSIIAVDLFCGVGGLSYGLKESGIQIAVGVDSDPTCQYAFEKNVDAEFVLRDIHDLNRDDVLQGGLNASNHCTVIVGCAPCQPFSSHSNKVKERTKSPRWNLLNEFLRIIHEVRPDVISMENVPNLASQEVFREFVTSLESVHYHVRYSIVYCPDYGIPQKRRRLVLFASKYGYIDIMSPTHAPSEYITVEEAIGSLPPIAAGETCESDSLHRASRLSKVNLRRIEASMPNGTWKDWDEDLKLICHKRDSGATYSSVYGRMSKSEPSPTITTQFYTYGTGRFGHPDQNRALSLREGALLQSFPQDYEFIEQGATVSMKTLGTHIGNAVPVKLGNVIGKTIKSHVEFWRKNGEEERV